MYTREDLRKELKKHSLEDLRNFCSSSKSLRNYSKLKKAELIDYLIRNTQEEDEPTHTSKKSSSGSNSGDFDVMRYHFLSKKEITHNLSRYKPEESKYREFKNTREKYRFAKEVFGDMLIPLNKNLTRKLVGKNIYVLSGKSWYENLSENSSNKHKLDYIRKLSILEEGEEEFLVKEKHLAKPYHVSFGGFTMGCTENDLFAFAVKD